jgi:hypothetical protein
MSKPPPTVSRMRPHRWCGRVHFLIVLFGWLMIMMSIVSDVMFFLKAMAVGAAIGVAIVVLATFGPFHKHIDKIERVEKKVADGMVQLEKASVPNSWLHVDAAWARAAVLLDIVAVALSAQGLSAQIQYMIHHSEQKVSGGLFSEILVTVAGPFFFGIQIYVHWRATRRPRRRTRSEALAAAMTKA